MDIDAMVRQLANLSSRIAALEEAFATLHSASPVMLERPEVVTASSSVSQSESPAE